MLRSLFNSFHPSPWFALRSMKLLTLKREALAAGMREHTKAPIHASLTEMDSKRSKIACRMFKNIMVLTSSRPSP